MNPKSYHLNQIKCVYEVKIAVLMKWENNNFIINELGIEMDEERTKIILENPIQNNLENYIKLLGLINYYERNIPNISEN